MLKNSLEIKIIPISQGKKDKRKGKMCLSTIHRLICDTDIFIAYGIKRIELVRKIPDDKRQCGWCQIGI